MTNSNAATALQELGKKIGIPEMCFDDDGRCTLSFDEVITHLQLSEDGNALTGYFWIADVETEQRTPVALAISEVNYLLTAPLGATLGMHRDTGDLVLCLKMDDLTLTPEYFEEALEELITFAQTWQQKIASEFSGSSETRSAPMPADSFSARV